MYLSLVILCMFSWIKPSSRLPKLMNLRGGKAAMSVALHPSLAEPRNAHLLSNLIVADVSPTKMQLSPEFKGYIQAMKKIESMKLTTRKQALEVLEAYEPVLIPLSNPSPDFI